jgi:hypothetical protein
VVLFHVGVVQRLGYDVLRHRVHLRGEAGLVLDGRPGRGEPVVGGPAEQLRIRRVELGELRLITLGAAVEGGPVSGRPRPGAARVLDDAVQGDELGDHDLAHVRCPYLFSPGHCAPGRTPAAITAAAGVRARR